MMMPIERAVESATNLVTLNGLLGDYSIGLHLGLCFSITLFFMATVAAIVKLRGQGNALVAVCMQDVLYAVGCAVIVFAFPGYFYFLGRAFWRAFTWGAQEGGEDQSA